MSNSNVWPDPDSQLAGHGRSDVRGVYLLSPSTQKAVEPSGGGGGGGGAVTVADGADVTQGTSTDAANANTVIGQVKQVNAVQGGTGDSTYVSGSGTVIALLKGLFTKLAGTLTISGAVTTSGTVTEANSATINTNTANIPGKGANTVANSMPITNAAVQGWIAATGTGTASQDDSLTFASQVRKVVLYNAAAVPVPFEFDTASTATSIPIQPGQYMVFDDILCTIVHVFPSATLPINTTSGLYVKGWK